MTAIATAIDEATIDKVLAGERISARRGPRALRRAAEGTGRARQPPGATSQKKRLMADAATRSSPTSSTATSITPTSATSIANSAHFTGPRRTPTITSSPRADRPETARNFQRQRRRPGAFAGRASPEARHRFLPGDALAHPRKISAHQHPRVQPAGVQPFCRSLRHAAARR